MDKTEAKVAALCCWRGPVSPQPLPGGITNVNYVVEDAGEKFVVRLGGDIPVHQVMRFNELAASRAAWAEPMAATRLPWRPAMRCWT